jgi:pimeloyl-ACP methyl ester carboxylesterase
MASFTYQDQRIAYTEYGKGHPVILVHGLLLSQEMHRPLAEDLAARGNRAITVDLLGHGASDRPRDMWRYSMSLFADQLLALLDHLELKEAVVMGTSLGANAALELAVKAPERLRAMVIEMPVLDNAIPASALTFTPILLALTFGESIMKFVGRGARAVPRGALPHYGNVVLDLVRQEPGPGGALLQGLFFGRIAPPRSERRTIQTPALVLGHRRDPVHPFSDAGHLAEELPHGRLLQADSLVELRLNPARLTDEIAAYLDEVWATPRPRRARTGTTAKTAKATGRRGAASSAARATSPA